MENSGILNYIKLLISQVLATAKRTCWFHSARWEKIDFLLVPTVNVQAHVKPNFNVKGFIQPPTRPHVTWSNFILCVCVCGGVRTRIKTYERPLQNMQSPLGVRRAAAGIGLHVNAHKTEYMCYNQTGDISTQGGTSLKLVDKFPYLRSSVSSTEKDIDTRLTKAWTAIDRLLIMWKSDLTEKMKRRFFQAVVVSILLYGCTTWTLTKQLEKKLDGNYTRMLRAILNKSWRQHPARHQLYSHLPPITKTIQARRTRHAGHCWRSKDEVISDVLLWTPTYGQAKAGQTAWTFIQKHSEDTGCSSEDQPEAMNDREWGSGISVLAARHDDDDDEIKDCNPTICRKIDNKVIQVEGEIY